MKYHEYLITFIESTYNDNIIASINLEFQIPRPPNIKQFALSPINFEGYKTYYSSCLF